LGDNIAELLEGQLIDFRSQRTFSLPSDLNWIKDGEVTPPPSLALACCLPTAGWRFGYPAGHVDAERVFDVSPKSVVLVSFFRNCVNERRQRSL
jgi:hypothetical protein